MLSVYVNVWGCIVLGKGQERRQIGRVKRVALLGGSVGV